MSEDIFKPTPYERLQLFVGKRQIDRERPVFVRIGIAVLSLLGPSIPVVVDMTDATVDACYYSFNGKGDSLEDVADSFQWQGLQENCTPSIEF